MAVHAVSLEVVSGDDRGLAGRVAQPTFTIGSDEGADLRLRDPAVSRSHVRILLSADGIRLVDESSKNGTWMGGSRVRDISIFGDAAIEVGSTSIVLRVDRATTDLPLSASSTFGDAFGESDTMRHVFALLERAATSELTILLEGESGVGKEVLARAIHNRSPRAEGPLVTVDCGAIPAALLESELFGHERGAFTGADKARVGSFEEADNGTLFLDEIGELPLELQPKLLRVLESGEIRRVGGSSAYRRVNVRVIAATNRQLAESTRRGEFREDLFYRLAVARVRVPPLRDRADDVLPLATRFMRRAVGDENATLPPEFAALLRSYDWPGNVRELRHVVERFTLLGARGENELFDRSLRGTTAPPRTWGDLPYHEARKRAVDVFEQEYVRDVLERAGGVVVRAAELANVSRPTFYRMLERVRSGDDE